jgi:hypothetical protein
LRSVLGVFIGDLPRLGLGDAANLLVGVWLRVFSGRLTSGFKGNLLPLVLGLSITLTPFINN